MSSLTDSRKIGRFFSPKFRKKFQWFSKNLRVLIFPRKFAENWHVFSQKLAKNLWQKTCQFFANVQEKKTKNMLNLWKLLGTGKWGAKSSIKLDRVWFNNDGGYRLGSCKPLPNFDDVLYKRSLKVHCVTGRPHITFAKKT